MQKPIKFTLPERILINLQTVRSELEMSEILTVGKPGLLKQIGKPAYLKKERVGIRAQLLHQSFLQPAQRLLVFLFRRIYLKSKNKKTRKFSVRLMHVNMAGHKK